MSEKGNLLPHSKLLLRETTLPNRSFTFSKKDYRKPCNYVTLENHNTSLSQIVNIYTGLDIFYNLSTMYTKNNEERFFLLKNVNLNLKM